MKNQTEIPPQQSGENRNSNALNRHALPLDNNHK